MTVQRIAITPFTDQKPGTSGLRKSTRAFQEPHYLAAFVQAIFEVQPIVGPLILGGDGRFYNDEAMQLILRIAAANGARRVIVGRNGLLSTPAASHLVRQRHACGAIILSASHNPGGADGDFGVKFNGPNGAPAAEAVTEAVYARSLRLTEYRRTNGPPVSLSKAGEQMSGRMVVEVVDPTADYGDLMERLFDFDLLRKHLRSPGGRIAFDGMSAVTGPYAREVFETRLQAPETVLLRCTPRPDFGGGHPDPTPANAPDLMALMDGPDAPLLGAASDGDGDRHLIVGPQFAVGASDSLAILTANADLIPGYRGRLTGVARSMPTSRAVDVVARASGIPCFETPTGWKYFGSLLDAGMITLCGEESAGAGSDHVREKDGLWAVLFWLNILAARGQSVEMVVREHWARYGRHATMRLDYEGVSLDGAIALMTGLRASLGSLPGASFHGRLVEAADDFAYSDPVSTAVTVGHGIRVFLTGDARMVFRLSGTGTSGATLRIYLEQAARSPGADLNTNPAASLEQIAVEIAQLQRFTGRQGPTYRG